MLNHLRVITKIRGKNCQKKKIKFRKILNIELKNALNMHFWQFEHNYSKLVIQLKKKYFLQKKKLI